MGSRKGNPQLSPKDAFIFILKQLLEEMKEFGCLVEKLVFDFVFLQKMFVISILLLKFFFNKMLCDEFE